MVRAKLAHLRHLVDDEDDGVGVQWAPPLPVDMGDAEWANLLGCSYFDVDVAEAMVSEEGTVVDDGQDEEDDEDCIDHDEDEAPPLDGKDKYVEPNACEEEIMATTIACRESTPTDKNSIISEEQTADLEAVKTMKEASGVSERALSCLSTDLKR